MKEIIIPKNRLYKWIGGKNWLSNQLKSNTEQYINNDVDTYIEPFIGGLGSFLSILPILVNKGINTFIINDINPIIINLLKTIKDNPNNLIQDYNDLQKKFYETYPSEVYKLHTTKDKVKVKELLENANLFFTTMKQEFNLLKLKEDKTKKDLERLNVIFLFLMKNSFNGVYRENSKGEFNTPFNWNNKKEKIDKTKTIMEYHILFKDLNIIFENMDVFDLLEKYKNSKSFIYLDPPYANENENENKYNKDSFNFSKQIKLLEVLKNFKNFIYSNHSLEIFQNYFNEETNCFYIEIERKNIMTAKKEDRSLSIIEILGIKN